jgi:hypothetical protein
MTTPTVIETRRNGNQIRPVGPRVELARYTLRSGEQRILYSQRVDGVVRFLPGNPVALVASRGSTEDSTCRSRTTIRAGGCASPVRRQGSSGVSEAPGLVAHQREGRS